jgi:ATP phosphoribosyltransferase regulatory subunit
MGCAWIPKERENRGVMDREVDREVMVPVTPRGFKDVLPEEARWRESITTAVQGVLSSWGYAPIETPTLEVLEVLEQGGRLSETPFRLFDSDGALLVLRPDVTLPIARLVASRLVARHRAPGASATTHFGKGASPSLGAGAGSNPSVNPGTSPSASPGATPNPTAKPSANAPLRFRYVQPVFREEESLRGQAREFTQIGIESIGPSDAAADAEVLLLLVDALKACGLKEFTVAICTVGVLRDLLAAIVNDGDATEEWRTAVLAACHKNNVVEVGRLAHDPRVDKRYGAALQALLNLRGGAEAIEQCRALVEPLGCTDGLSTLAQTYDIIAQVGAAPFVSVDFSVMSAFDYYTGLVFEAYAPRLGVALGSGGRYDRMLEHFGAKAPAAGFAFNLERVMFALLEQGVAAGEGVARPCLSPVLIEAAHPAEAFIEAARLRAQGKSAVLVRSEPEEDAVAAAAAPMTEAAPRPLRPLLEDAEGER